MDQKDQNGQERRFLPGRKVKKPRQEWNPHWSIKLLYNVWRVLFNGFKIAMGAAATVLLILIVCGVVFVSILGDYLQNDILPMSQQYESSISDLEQTSFVYYVNSKGEIEVAQRIHTTVDRQWASYEEIPENLINAAIAIEDKRFYEHQGVDWITTVKACLNMFMGGDQFGGSTITQQFIKNDTTENSVTVQRKVAEIFRALYVEKKVEKDTIMEWYLNTIYFGRGCYGVRSAAAEYFGKELQSLTVAECASLISITNNPSLFNPYRTNLDKDGKTGAEQNRIRQENTLYEMKVQGWITEQEYDEAIAQEMVFRSGIKKEDRWVRCANPNCPHQGTVSSYTAQGNGYYCPVCGTQAVVTDDASQEVYSYFIDTVLEDVAADLAALNNLKWSEMDTPSRQGYMEKIRRGGYHIYTTLDMDVQNQVDKIYEDLSQIPGTRSNQQLQSAIVVIDNRTGDIVAMSGGVGKKTVHDGQNRAIDSKLQTGSSQKPISVYAPAFESGKVSPVTVIPDMPVKFTGGGWPKNDNRVYNYARTVYQGVVSSINAIAVRTLEVNSYEYSYNFAKDNFGLSTLTDYYLRYDGEVLSDLGSAPLAMGALTVGATVRDMSAAYATFPNQGVYREARTYTKVYDSDGNLVLDNTQDSKRIISEKTANYMNYCLYGSANHGTGGNALFGGQNIAGKTGTTSSNRDRWFCGYTGHYTAAVWCGYDNPEQIRLDVNSNPAAILWRKVMQPIHKGLPQVPAFNGTGMHNYTICLDSGLLATNACSRDVRDVARTATARCYPEDVPAGYCNKHISVDYCVTGEGVATEWCAKFEDAKIEKRSLVKLNGEEIDFIKKASRLGLNAVYSADNYVYYTNDDGKPIAWHGFSGNVNPSGDTPYIVCPLHTEEAWKEYEESQKPTEPEEGEEETDPTNPTDPTDPTDPTQPSNPNPV